MRTNTSCNVGTLILINKVNKEFNLFYSIFDKLKGKTKHFIESVKMFINNRLDKCVSVSQIPKKYAEEWFECMGFKEKPKERTTYRDLERIGLNNKFIVENAQQLLKKFRLIDNIQFVDFSSALFEGDKAELGALGYSRDNEPSKKQLTFGISTGMNGISSGITIQKGNVQDKQHMKFMMKILFRVLDKGSLAIFDCGGNTKENRQEIIDAEFNYLTLRARNRSTYLKYMNTDQVSEIWKIAYNNPKCFTRTQNLQVKSLRGLGMSDFIEDMPKLEIRTDKPKCQNLAYQIKNLDFCKLRKGIYIGSVFSMESIYNF